MKEESLSGGRKKKKEKEKRNEGGATQRKKEESTRVLKEELLPFLRSRIHPRMRTDICTTAFSHKKSGISRKVRIRSSPGGLESAFPQQVHGGY